MKHLLYLGGKLLLLAASIASCAPAANHESVSRLWSTSLSFTQACSAPQATLSEKATISALFSAANLGNPAINTINCAKLQEVLETRKKVFLPRAALTTLAPMGLLKLSSILAPGGMVTSLAGLEGNTLLETVDVSRNKIVSLERVISFPALLDLNLGDNQLTTLEFFPDSPLLKKLRLSGNRLTTLYGLPALEKLEYLALGKNALTDLYPVLSLPNLKTLDIVSNEICDTEVIEQLAANGVTVIGADQQRCDR